MRLGKVRFEAKYIAIQYFYENRHWSIRWMCQQLDITRAAYYKWLHREIPEAEQENIPGISPDGTVYQSFEQ